MSDFDDIRCLDAPLADKLEAYAIRMEGRVPDVARAYSDLVNRLRNAGAGDAALGVGDRMPEFALPDATSHILRSSELLADGPLVVSFNRGHWCAFCRLEFLSFAEISAKVQEMGARIVSIMPETGRTTRSLIDTFGLDFPILTDIDNGFSLRMNLMIALGPAISSLFRSRGTDLARFQGNAAWFVPIPATYVIDQDGIIRASFVDPDFRRRMPASDILAALSSIAGT